MGAALDLLTLPKTSAPFKVAPLNQGVVEPAQCSLGMPNSFCGFPTPGPGHDKQSQSNVKLYDYSWSVLSEFAETLIGTGTCAN